MSLSKRGLPTKFAQLKKKKKEEKKKKKKRKKLAD